MPISASDIKVKHSVKTGAAGNSTAGTPSGSLGKYISTTELTDNSLHNLFDVISGDENAASDVEYRCIFIHNSHATISFDNVVIYMLSETASGASAALGIDPTAASAIGSAGAQAVEIANEGVAPAGVVFTVSDEVGEALSLGTIPAGQCKALWIRRTAANTAGMSSDGVVLRIQGESL